MDKRRANETRMETGGGEGGTAGDGEIKASLLFFQDEQMRRKEETARVRKIRRTSASKYRKMD